MRSIYVARVSLLLTVITCFYYEHAFACLESGVFCCFIVDFEHVFASWNNYSDLNNYILHN